MGLIGGAIAFGRRFEQRFWFSPYESVGSLESAELRVRHELPDPPVVRSWRIEAADLATEGDRTSIP